MPLENRIQHARIGLPRIACGATPVALVSSAQIDPQSGSTVDRSVGQMRSGCVAMNGLPRLIHQAALHKRA